MVTRADFDIITVRQTFNSNNNDRTFNFRIEPSAPSIGDDLAYVIMQVRSVGEPANHQIIINDRLVDDFSFQPAPGASQAWLTHMFTFSTDFLEIGINRFRIRRRGNDNFEIRDIVIHWRERE